jgi:hypothetical protein
LCAIVYVHLINKDRKMKTMTVVIQYNEESNQLPQELLNAYKTGDKLRSCNVISAMVWPNEPDYTRQKSDTDWLKEALKKPMYSGDGRSELFPVRPNGKRIGGDDE